MGLLGDLVSSFVQSNPIGQAINAGVSLVNGAFDRHAQKESNKRNAEQNELNREFNAEEAEKNRQFQSAETAKQNAFNAAQSQLAFDRSARFQQEMWQKENEYNTPLAQIKRLEQAGINPNLFGGDNTAGSAGSAVSPAASGSAPSGSAASVGSSIPNLPLSYTNPLLEAAQIRSANATADLAEADADDKRAKTPLEVELLKLERDYKDVQIKGAFKDLDVKDAQISQYAAEMTKLYSEANHFNQAVQESIQRSEFIQEQSNVARAERKRLQYENSRMEEYWNAKIKNIVADTDEKLANAGFHIKNTELLQEQIYNAIKDGKLKDLQFEITDGTKEMTIRANNEENNKIVLDCLSDTSSPEFVEFRSWMRATGSALGGLSSGLGRAAAAIK